MGLSPLAKDTPSGRIVEAFGCFVIGWITETKGKKLEKSNRRLRVPMDRLSYNAGIEVCVKLVEDLAVESGNPESGEVGPVFQTYTTELLEAIAGHMRLLKRDAVI